MFRCRRAFFFSSTLESVVVVRSSAYEFTLLMWYRNDFVLVCNSLAWAKWQLKFLFWFLSRSRTVCSMNFWFFSWSLNSSLPIFVFQQFFSDSISTKFLVSILCLFHYVFASASLFCILRLFHSLCFSVNLFWFDRLFTIRWKEAEITWCRKDEKKPAFHIYHTTYWIIQVCWNLSAALSAFCFCVSLRWLRVNYHKWTSNSLTAWK